MDEGVRPESRRNLRVGDVVIVMEPTGVQTPVGQFPVARVTEVLPADDGVVRIVRVKMSSCGETLSARGELRRLIFLFSLCFSVAKQPPPLSEKLQPPQLFVMWQCCRGACFCVSSVRKIIRQRQHRVLSLSRSFRS